MYNSTIKKHVRDCSVLSKKGCLLFLSHTQTSNLLTVGLTTLVSYSWVCRVAAQLLWTRPEKTVTPY